MKCCKLADYIIEVVSKSEKIDSRKIVHRLHSRKHYLVGQRSVESCLKELTTEGSLVREEIEGRIVYSLI